MVEVLEFKNVDELNRYLEHKVFAHQFDIIPVNKMFEHPQTKLIISCITYVVVIS